MTIRNNVVKNKYLGCLPLIYPKIPEILEFTLWM